MHSVTLTHEPTRVTYALRANDLHPNDPSQTAVDVRVFNLLLIGHVPVKQQCTYNLQYACVAVYIHGGREDEMIDV